MTTSRKASDPPQADGLKWTQVIRSVFPHLPEKRINEFAISEQKKYTQFRSYWNRVQTLLREGNIAAARQIAIPLIPVYLSHVWTNHKESIADLEKQLGFSFDPSKNKKNNGVQPGGNAAKTMTKALATKKNKAVAKASHPGKIKTHMVGYVLPSAPQGHSLNLPQRKHTTNSDSDRRPPRYRPGTRALREIRYHQKHTRQVIPRKPFQRLLRELLADADPHPEKNKKWGQLGVQSVQEAAENYLINLLEDTNLAAIHSNRITIQPKDMDLVRRLRGERT